MRRWVLLAMALLIPALVFLNVWQGYRYGRLQREVSRLEEEQKSWLELNKRLIAGIAVFRSPSRIEKLAREKLGLEKIDPARVLQVNVGRQQDAAE